LPIASASTAFGGNRVIIVDDLGEHRLSLAARSDPLPRNLAEVGAGKAQVGSRADTI
jgi:hypothetical protein